MTKTVFAVAFLLFSVASAAPQKASAQSEVLAEMYGRGVHAFYSGDYATAQQFLSLAIDNGSQDPRAYYFRGLVEHTSGQLDQAKMDWQRGADLEANGKANGAIGRSLSRFQGQARLELESIRQQARLTALATAAARSKARYGEIEAAEARVLRQPPQPAAPVAPPQPKNPAPVAPVAPPVAAQAADQDDPFADDLGAPDVESDDALKNAMTDPFGGAAAVPAGDVPPSDDTDPFGGAGGGADPFGGGDAGGADPFGGGDAGGADPFGGGAADTGAAEEADPFGGGGADAGGAMEEDPFGGNPFDN